MSTIVPQILIVDDEVDICTNMADIFADLGYRVDVANNGPAALALVQKSRYDIAILDLMMPGMDGAELYVEIKKLHAGTIAILVTAYPEHPRASTALAAGAWRILPKPVDLPPLLRMIDQAANQPMLLVVDDDLDYCANMWDLLRERGYRPCLANNLETATRMLNEGASYNLVLLDMRLPDGNGSALVHIAREQHPSIPIVVISGCSTEFQAKIAWLLSEGAKAVFPKPLEVAKLLDMVQKLVPVSAAQNRI